MTEPTLAEAIRQCRKKHGYRQVDLAKELGVTNITVSRWERGHTTTLHIENANKLVELGVNARHFMAALPAHNGQQDAGAPAYA